MTDALLTLAKNAGNAILDIYSQPTSQQNITAKEDDSPLTKADQVAHQMIVRGLSDLYPDMPIISEEGEIPPYQIRQNWHQFWLVDPLDGTKEFIQKNGQFTVNIAFIEDRESVLGIIYYPVKNQLFVGDVIRQEAYVLEGQQKTRLKVTPKQHHLVAVKSRSHCHETENDILEKLNVSQTICIGSSLKFCLLAEGKADVYYRKNPTMEWDIAAGHAILRAAGGEVYHGQTTEVPFQYNKPSLKNDSFLAIVLPNSH